MKIHIINGPNLNVLERRQLYGGISLDEIQKVCLERSKQLNIRAVCWQSNYEGEIVEYIQNLQSDGLVINAAAYTHTSIAILDALSILTIPIVEVHISNIFQREDFRKNSYISTVASAIISGMGIDGYKFAIEHLHNLIKLN